MATDDHRINLDEDLGDLETTLAKDVEEAAKAIRDRKANDAAHDAQKKKDTAIKYGLIFIGVVLVFILAYWMTFVRGSAVEVPSSAYQPPPAQTQTASPQQQVQPSQQQPINRPPVTTTRPQGPPPGQSPDEFARPDM